MSESTYEQKLAEEAELWGSESERMAQTTPPDWRYHKTLRHNVIMHGRNIEALLNRVQPGMQTLELGCASGWLTLAMAQRGAHSTGIDISDKSLEVARQYYESIRDEVPGTVTYTVGDLNNLTLPANTYDIIAVKATLHHLVNLRHTVDVMHDALKPGGLLWVSDSVGDESLFTALVASGLMFILPTQVSYGDKIRGLLKFGTRAPSRIKASMEAEGLSPFEGAGRDHDWLHLISQRFTIEKRVNLPAVTGYITAQLNMPDVLAIPLLKTLHLIDIGCVKLRLLNNTGVVLYARKS